MFDGKTTPLRNLFQETYVLNVAKRVNNCKFGKQYMLSLGEEDNPTIVWSNISISNKLQEAEDLELIDVDGIYQSLRNKKLGFLRVTGKGTNLAGHNVVFCQLSLNPKEGTESTQIMKPSKEVVENVQAPIIPREQFLNFREYPNLTYLTVGGVYNIDGWGYISHYGTERLVVSVDGKIFQGGDDLEEKFVQLKYMSKIKIEKLRTNVKLERNMQYALYLKRGIGQHL